ncbi:MAG: adenosylmethionine decarboxylase [Candidatus Gastranaerophilales bacterium]|nr:adenosylmethionine decarboxylase [Candidatus Gastranaerophilales bacterium]
MNNYMQHPEKQVTGYLGRHILAEFFDCNPNVLNNLELIEKKMTDAAVACGATVVQTCFHMFNPHGVSGVVIISESHLAIHTWPELGYAAVDLFTCGENCDPKVAYEFLKNAFNSKSGSYSELRRGLLQTSDLVSKAPFYIKDQIEV